MAKTFDGNKNVTNISTYKSLEQNTLPLDWNHHINFLIIYHLQSLSNETYLLKIRMYVLKAILNEKILYVSSISYLRSVRLNLCVTLRIQVNFCVLTRLKK